MLNSIICVLMHVWKPPIKCRRRAYINLGTEEQADLAVTLRAENRQEGTTWYSFYAQFDNYFLDNA
jgi:hypothetical protein